MGIHEWYAVYFGNAQMSAPWVISNEIMPMMPYIIYKRYRFGRHIVILECSLFLYWYSINSIRAACVKLFLCLNGIDFTTADTRHYSPFNGQAAALSLAIPFWVYVINIWLRTFKCTRDKMSILHIWMVFLLSHTCYIAIHNANFTIEHNWTSSGSITKIRPMRTCVCVHCRRI